MNDAINKSSMWREGLLIFPRLLFDIQLQLKMNKQKS